jgi:hypothetical protein
VTACEHAELSSDAWMMRDGPTLSSVQRGKKKLAGELTAQVIFLALNSSYFNIWVPKYWFW